MHTIVMPKLSDSMNEGTIVGWVKADGEPVIEGEEIAEIETDKATMGYESEYAGILHIVAPVGAIVPVGGVIGTVETSHVDSASEVKTSTDVRAGRSQARAAGDNTWTASPLARRLALDLDVELQTVRGSGRDGRVLKRDVILAAAVRDVPAEHNTPMRESAAAGERSAADAGSPIKGPDARLEPFTRTQSLIARRMTESRATIPEFRVEVEVDMSAATDLSRQFRSLVETPPSINDMIIKASAVTLRRHPRMNATYVDSGLKIHEEVAIGFAVAVDGGLLVPTVRNADLRSLGQIASETRELVTKARDSTISPVELGSPTFTISNLGMFGVSRFDAIINPPEAAILSVGAITDRPAVVDGCIEARPLMCLTLVCDHRIVYGADAARFIADLRGILESPLIMML